MAFKIFVSHNLTTPDDVIMTVREVANPTVDAIPSVFYPAPHSQVNVTMEVPRGIMYKVQFWKTSDGSTLDSLVGGADIDASISTQSKVTFVQFVAGRGNTGAPYYDPAIGDTEYINPDLLHNLTSEDFLVFKVGYGPLNWQMHIQTVIDGFEFIDGQEFSEGDEYTVMVFNNVVANIATTTGGPFPDGFVPVNADLDFVTADHLNKVIKLTFTGLRVSLNIPNLDLIPDLGKFGINTDESGGSTGMNLILPAGKTCNINGTGRNIVYIGTGERVTFVRNGDVLELENYDGDYARVGELVFASSIGPRNGLAAVGGWYAQDQYPRLVQWYINSLDPSELGSGSDDVTPAAAHLSKWILGAEKFWVPDLRDFFPRISDGVRKAGTREDEQIGNHFHDVGTQPNTGIAKWIRGATAAIRNWNTGNSQNAGTASTGSTYQNTDTTSPTASPENRPKNVAFNAYFIV